MSKPNAVPLVEELLRDSPKNWGKWGPDDEVGSLNYLNQEAVLNAVSAVRQGKVFALQTPMASPKGDPVWHEDRDFIDAVRGLPDRIRCSYREALQTHRLALAIARSAAQETPVQLAQGREMENV